jgi:hypothetical protein
MSDSELICMYVLLRHASLPCIFMYLRQALESKHLNDTVSVSWKIGRKRPRLGTERLSPDPLRLKYL